MKILFWFCEQPLLQSREGFTSSPSWLVDASDCSSKVVKNCPQPDKWKGCFFFFNGLIFAFSMKVHTRNCAVFWLPVRKGLNDLVPWFSVFVNPFTLSHLLPQSLFSFTLYNACSKMYFFSSLRSWQWPAWLCPCQRCLQSSGLFDALTLNILSKKLLVSECSTSIQNISWFL